MVGTVGRTDLCGPALAEPLARAMFRSLRRFDQFADALAVYPTHGPGSFCAAPGTAAHTTTLGIERGTNPLLAITDEDEFVTSLLGGLGSFPPYFRRLPELNRLGPARIDAVPPLACLDSDAVATTLDRGGLLIDARPLQRSASGHIPGSVLNPLRPVFGTWLGWLASPDRPLLFVLDPDQDRTDLVRQCLDVGLEHLTGEIDGGIDTWIAAGRRVNSTLLIGPRQLTGTVIDVRQASEYRSGHVPGARNIELGSMATAPLPPGLLIVMCGHGERALTAASLLAARGVDAVVFDGGPDTWAAATGHPLEVSP